MHRKRGGVPKHVARVGGLLQRADVAHRDTHSRPPYPPGGSQRRQLGLQLLALRLGGSQAGPEGAGGALGGLQKAGDLHTPGLGVPLAGCEGVGVAQGVLQGLRQLELVGSEDLQAWCEELLASSHGGVGIEVCVWGWEGGGVEGGGWAVGGFAILSGCCEHQTWS